MRVAVALLAFRVAFSPAPAAPARAAMSAQVDAAIHKAKDFLYSQMNDGNWEVVLQPDPTACGSKVEGKQWGGPTAMAVYALLAAGESPQEPKLVPAIAFLKKAKIEVPFEAVSLSAPGGR